MEDISIKVFGTPDYGSMLSILSPYDGMVKEFNREVEKLKLAECKQGETYECD